VRACGQARGQVWACAVLCRLPLEHVTAARHVLVLLCCGALSCRPPGGEGSGMRQQDAAAECDSRRGRQKSRFWTKQRESTATRHARVQSASSTVLWSSMGKRSPRLAQRFAGGRSQSTPDRGVEQWSSLTRTTVGVVSWSGQGDG
jgi:hypothetical protein